ncbi:hypothetical protein ACTFIY_004600 [Dictyostelium cf. discoideum]
MYLVKFKGYPEPEYVKEVDTDCEELIIEYWNNVQKKHLSSRRERENATIEAVEPIISSYSLKKFKVHNHRNQLLQDVRTSPIQIDITNQRKENQETKTLQVMINLILLNKLQQLDQEEKLHPSPPMYHS